MMSVMPVITTAASTLPSPQAGVDKGTSRFDEALRTESAALGRADQRAAVQKTSSPQDDREASLRTAGHKQQDRETKTAEPAAAEPAAGPAPVVSSPGEAGAKEVVAAGVTPEKGKIDGVQEDNQPIPVQVDQSQPLPTWLLVTQPVALPFAAVEAGVEAQSNSGAQRFRMVAATQLSSVPTGVALDSEMVAENSGLATPNQAAFASVVATDELTGAVVAQENIASMAAGAPESKVAQVQQPSGEIAGQVPLRPAIVAEMAAPVNAGILTSASTGSASDSKKDAALPVSDLLAFTPIVPEVTSRAAMTSPIALSQAFSPETLSRAASLAALSQAPSPQAASQAANPEVVSQGANPETLAQATSPVLLSQATSPETLAQAASPVLLSQAAGTAVISSTIPAQRPVSAPGENAPVVDAARTGNPGLQATVVAAPLSADSSNDQRQFADFDHPIVREVEEGPRPADTGRTEFSNLLTGSDQAGLSGSSRSSGTAQVLPAATSTPAMDGRIVEQVVSRVNLSAASGETSLSLTLHPKELGEVRVELVSGKDGLRAHLHSQSQMVQEVLERHLPRLREAFEAQGVKLSDLQVSCDGRRDGGNAAFQQREQGQLPQSRYQIADSRAGAGTPPEWAGGLGASSSGWSSAPGFSLRV